MHLKDDKEIAAEEAARVTARRLRNQNNALVQLSKITITGGADAQSALRDIVEVAARTLQCERVSVWQYGSKDELLRCGVLYELGADTFTKGMELHRAEYPAYFEALRVEHRIVAHDAQNDPRTREFRDGYLTPLGITSMLDVPILDGGRILGVLCNEHVGPPRTWVSDEENFASAIANLVSIVLAAGRRARKAEQPLQLRDAFQSMVEHSLDIMAVVDEQGRITYVTPSVHRVLGYRTEDLIGKASSDYVHPEDLPALVQTYRRPRRADEAAPVVTCRVRHKEGTWRYFETAGNRLYPTAGVPGIVVSFRDVTERKLWERAIRESERRNSAVIDNAMDAYLAMNASGMIIGWNTQAEAMFGWRREKVLGQRLSSVILPPSQRDEHERGRERFLATGEGHLMNRRIEMTALHRDGHEFPVELSMTHVRIGDSHTFSAFIRDISARRAGERALQESEERFRILVEHAPEAIVVIDAETALFVDSNHNAQRMFGYDAEEMRRIGPREVTSAQDLTGQTVESLVEERLRRALEGGALKFEITCQHKSGRTFPTEVRLVRLPATGRKLVRGSVTDISERRWAQKLHQDYSRTLEEQVAQRTRELEAKNAELQQALEKLKDTQRQLITQEKMASLGVLTAGIAHEIKNPLNFVNNFAELTVELIQELRALLAAGASPEGSIPEEEASLLRDIEQNAVKIHEHGKRADRIVRGMLQHSRSEHMRQTTDINALVDEYVKLAYHGLRARDASFNIRLDLQYDEHIGSIPVVPQDLSRVILNIVNNGCYAAHQKRKSLGSDFHPVLTVRTRDAGDFVEIRVRDNGPGIPPEIRDSIFNPFFTTKPVGEGTGLGLSICYDIIVREHLGELIVDTESGEFTEFAIALPKKPPQRDRVKP